MIVLPVKNRRDTYTINPTKLIALGLNYRAHIAESVSVKVKGFTDEVPTEPMLFPKTPNVLVGPDQAIVVPQFLNKYGFKTLRTDYEEALRLVFQDYADSLGAGICAAGVLQALLEIRDHRLAGEQRNQQAGDEKRESQPAEDLGCPGDGESTTSAADGEQQQSHEGE